MSHEARRGTDREWLNKLYASAAWQKTRAAVLERDGHRCVKCGKPTPSVHHKDYSDPLSEDTCETRCRSCHGKADFGRAPKRPSMWREAEKHPGLR